MEEENKKVNEAPDSQNNAAAAKDGEGDKAVPGEEAKESGPSWVTVYTDYGYGTVDAVKFKQMMEECQAAHERAQLPILEYFKEQHAILKQKHDEDLAAKKAEADAAAAEEERKKAQAASEEEKKNKAEADAAKAPEEGKAAKEEPSAEEAKKKEEEDKAKAAEEATNKRKAEREQALATTKQLLEQIQLTQEQKDSVSQIYNKITHVKFRWGGDGYIQRRLISSTITVNVKTLHGQRKTHTIQVSIFDKVEKIREKLDELEPEDMKQYPVPRLIWPMGKLRILDMSDVIEKVELKSNCTLVLMGLQSFCWDASNCDQSLKLENKATRVSHNGSERNHRTVIATQGFTQGRRYWEINCETLDTGVAVYIGICKMQDTVTLGELKDTYGILVPDCKTFERRPETSSYKMGSTGPKVTNGDIIGVLLEFESDSGKAKINFYKNGELLEQEFRDVKEGEYYPCLSINYGKNLVVLNSSARIPTGPIKKKEEPKKNLNELFGGGAEEEY